MMNCYLREINKILRYCTLCKSVLKCGFPTKGIKLTRFILFEALEVLQLWDISVLTILAGTTWKFAKYKWDYGIKKISVLDKLVRLCICSQHRVFPLSCWYFPVVREAYTVLRVEVKIFSWCSHGLPLIERNLKKWILSMKSSYIGRCSRRCMSLRQPESSIMH